jgi:antitoxin VapB
MAISLKDPEADRLARAIAERTGESLTRAIVTALRERLARLRHRPRSTRRRLRDELQDIGERCARLPTLDSRPEDAILGYDDRGLPG